MRPVAAALISVAFTACGTSNTLTTDGSEQAKRVLSVVERIKDGDRATCRAELKTVTLIRSDYSEPGPELCNNADVNTIDQLTWRGSGVIASRRAENGQHEDVFEFRLNEVGKLDHVVFLLDPVMAHG